MEFHEWLVLTESKDSFDRLRCIDEMPEASNEEIVPVLLRLLEDENEVVRTCAAEVINQYSENYQDIIKSALKVMIVKEDSPLAKSYAIVSLCEIADIDDFVFVAHLFETEKEFYVKMDISFGLFWASQKFLIDFFLKGIEDQKMSVSSINLMKFAYEYVYFNRTKVIVSLEEKLRLALEENTPKSLSLAGTIKAALEEIQEEGGNDDGDDEPA